MLLFDAADVLKLAINWSQRILKQTFTEAKSSILQMVQPNTTMFTLK